MNNIIIFNLFVITIITPLVNAHENHDHEIYNWYNLKKNNLKKDYIFNGEKLKDNGNKKPPNAKTN